MFRVIKLCSVWVEFERSWCAQDMNSINIRCSLEFTVKAVNCPNSWLFSAPLQPYININVDVFDQRFITRNVLPIFPLKFYERFRLSKTFVLHRNRWDILDALAGERIQIALNHVNYSGISKNLATYESYLLDFFPKSPLLFTYYDFKREIILTPVYSSYFRGIFGPRLQLSVCSFIREVPLDIYKEIPIARKFSSPKLINCRRGLACESDIEKQVVSDQMEDRPPFVVRRVDSKLISRLPSFYKEYESKRAYCCYSPHRDGQCAACRMDNIQMQSRHISQKPFRAPIVPLVREEEDGLIRQTRLNPLNEMENRQNNNVANEPREIMRTSPERYAPRDVITTSPERIPREMMTTSPERMPVEIMRTSPERVSSERRSASPTPFVQSPHVHWADNSAVNTGYQKSPIFNRPTFTERFRDKDVGNKENFTKQKPYEVPTSLDQAQQTDYIYPGTFFEKHAIEPFTCKGLMCNCHHQLNYQFDNCSCPYCPVYWRHRFDAPALHNSRHYWREYHRGLANIYDDLQYFS